MSPRLREAWYGKAHDWEGPAVGEHIVGSEPEGFVELKIQWGLVWWSPGFGRVWYWGAMGEPTFRGEP